MYVRGDGNDNLNCVEKNGELHAGYLVPYFGAEYPTRTWTDVMRLSLDDAAVEAVPAAGERRGEAGRPRAAADVHPDARRRPSSRPRSRRPEADADADAHADADADPPTPTPTPTPTPPTPDPDGPPAEPDRAPPTATAAAAVARRPEAASPSPYEAR